MLKYYLWLLKYGNYQNCTAILAETKWLNYSMLLFYYRWYGKKKNVVGSWTKHEVCNIPYYSVEYFFPLSKVDNNTN